VSAGPAGTDSLAAKTDTLDRIIAALDGKLAPLAVSDDSVARLLRADSATTRADSTLARYRESRRDLLRVIAGTFNDTVFEAIVLPEGSVADRRRREQKRQGLPVDPIDTVTADSIIRFLESRGVSTQMGEGQAYFEVSERHLLHGLGSFVTEPMRAYLRMEVMEQTIPTGGDGGVGISWDSLADRLEAADRLLASHRDIVVASQVQERIRWYLGAFLSGWDNTSVFVGRSRQLKPDVRTVYEWYAETHRAMATGKVVREYLELLESTGFRDGDSVRAFRRGIEKRPFPAPLSGRPMPSSAVFAEQPEHIELGACSGELCMKIEGRQVSYDTLTLYERPDTTSPIVARLAPPASVTVLDRRFHSRPAPFLVRVTHEEETDDEPLRYEPGDTLWVVRYIGEGHYAMREPGGKSVQFGLELEDSDTDGYPRCVAPDCWGWLIAQPRSASWFKLRLETGREGWAIPTRLGDPR
jgi:hypothetical protein